MGRGVEVGAPLWGRGARRKGSGATGGPPVPPPVSVAALGEPPRGCDTRGSYRPQISLPGPVLPAPGVSVNTK